MCLSLQEGNKGPQVPFSITGHPSDRKGPQKLPLTSAVSKLCEATPVLKRKAREGCAPALHSAKKGSAGGARGPAAMHRHLSLPSTGRLYAESQNGCPGKPPARRCSQVFMSCYFPHRLGSYLGECWDRPGLGRSRAEGCNSTPSSLGQRQPGPDKERLDSRDIG